MALDDDEHTPSARGLDVDALLETLHAQVQRADRWAQCACNPAWGAYWRGVRYGLLVAIAAIRAACT